MTTYTMVDLERVLRWRRRGLVIALAVVAIVLVAALSGHRVGLFGRCVDERPSAGVPVEIVSGFEAGGAGGGWCLERMGDGMPVEPRPVESAGTGDPAVERSE